MTGHFGVRGEDLAAHAVHLDAIGDQISTAARAGAATRARADAYGKLCVMVPVMLNVLQDVLVDGIQAAADSLRDAGDRLRATGQDYAAADERSTSELGPK